MVTRPDVWWRLETEVVWRPLAGNEGGLVSEAEAAESDAAGMATEPDAVGGMGGVLWTNR